MGNCYTSPTPWEDNFLFPAIDEKRHHPWFSRKGRFKKKVLFEELGEPSSLHKQQKKKRSSFFNNFQLVFGEDEHANQRTIEKISKSAKIIKHLECVTKEITPHFIKTLHSVFKHIKVIETLTLCHTGPRTFSFETFHLLSQITLLKSLKSFILKTTFGSNLEIDQSIDQSIKLQEVVFRFGGDSRIPDRRIKDFFQNLTQRHKTFQRLGLDLQKYESLHLTESQSFSLFLRNLGWGHNHWNYPLPPALLETLRTFPPHPGHSYHSSCFDLRMTCNVELAFFKTLSDELIYLSRLTSLTLRVCTCRLEFLSKTLEGLNYLEVLEITFRGKWPKEPVDDSTIDAAIERIFFAIRKLVSLKAVSLDFSLYKYKTKRLTDKTLNLISDTLILLKKLVSLKLIYIGSKGITGRGIVTLSNSLRTLHNLREFTFTTSRWDTSNTLNYLLAAIVHMKLLSDLTLSFRSWVRMSDSQLNLLVETLKRLKVLKTLDLALVFPSNIEILEDELKQAKLLSFKLTQLKVITFNRHKNANWGSDSDDFLCL